MAVNNLKNVHWPARPKNILFEQMRASSRPFSIAALSVGVLLFAVSGCSVNEHKNGDAENVHLHTPLGGLDVRTNSAAAVNVGIPIYPGAVTTGDKGKDSGAADIHMSFGKWQLHVMQRQRSIRPRIPSLKWWRFAKTPWPPTAMCSLAKTRRPSDNRWQPTRDSPAPTITNMTSAWMSSPQKSTSMSALRKSRAISSCSRAPVTISILLSSLLSRTEQNSRSSLSSCPIKVKPIRIATRLDCSRCDSSLASTYMDLVCHRCSATLEPESYTYCLACGAPQIRYVADDGEAAQAMPGVSVNLQAGATGTGASISWKLAIRIAGVVGTAVGVLSAVLAAGSVLWVAVGAVEAMRNYHRRLPLTKQGPRVVDRVGALLGLIAATVAFAANSVLLVIQRYGLHQGNQIDTQLTAIVTSRLPCGQQPPWTTPGTRCDIHKFLAVRQ